MASPFGGEDAKLAAMRRRLVLVLAAAALAGAPAVAAAPKAAGDAAVIGARLDLTSFANSTGPRRQPNNKTPADYGFTEVSVADGWASFVAPALGWRLGVKVLKRWPGRTLVCFADEARNGGSYFTQTTLILTPTTDHLYRAARSPETPACRTLTSRR
jgi:hypothetical protein